MPENKSEKFTNLICAFVKIFCFLFLNYIYLKYFININKIFGCLSEELYIHCGH